MKFTVLVCLCAIVTVMGDTGSSSGTQTTRNTWIIVVCAIGGSLLFFAVLYCICRRHRRVSVKNKTVVITGASAGLGEACARIFYTEGSRVVLCGRRTLELERVKQSLLASKV